MGADRSGSIERTGVALAAIATIGASTGAAVATLVARATDAHTLGPAAIGALAGIVVGWLLFTRRLARRLPDDLDGWFGRRPILAAVWSFTAVISVANTTRVTLFAADPAQSWASMFPPVPESARHQCFAAYVRAGDLASRGQADLWIQSDYASGPSGSTDVVGLAPYLGDPYEYPPPFAMLPRAAVELTDDYQSMRIAWFGISAIAFWLAFIALAMWVGGRAGGGAMLLLPVLALSFPVMECLQFGQAHLVVVAASIGAMIQLARGRPISGGLLLAFATVTKIFPGLLLVHLAVRRRWRDIAITVLAIAALVGLSALVLGVPTLEAYVSGQLPRMASGEAFAFTDSNPDNHSLYGLAFKLATLGVDGADRDLASILAWGWTAVAVILTVLGSWRDNDRRGDAILWLGIVCVGTLRSPYAPAYTAIATLWLLAISATVEHRRWPRSAAIAVSWFLLQGSPPMFGPEGNTLASFPSQLVTILIAVMAVWPRRRPA